MSNSNGIISKPVRLQQDVYPVLGISKQSNGYSLSYASANIHGKINKWSSNKPMRYNSFSLMTDQQKSSINYGYDIAAASDKDLNELFKKASTNPTWNYLYPRGKAYNEYYRLGDFIGYNSNAQVPFNYDGIPTSIPTINETIAYVFKFNANQNVDIDFNAFSYFNQYPANNNYRYAIAYKKSGSTSVSYALGPDIKDMKGRDITIQVPFGLGTYDCLFMITTLNNPVPIYTNNTYLPNGLFEVTVYKQTRTALVTIKSGFSSLRMDSTSIYGLSTIQLSIQSDSSTAVPPTYGRLDLLIYAYDYSNNLMGSLYVTDTANGTFSYSGVSAQTYSLNYLNGGEIRFSEYGFEGRDVARCEVIPQLIRTSGDGTFKFAANYNFPANR